jgi:hypothetical protein
MLVQLICVDRRYQRMNCFNMRELQSILKKRFFTDLITTNDNRELLHSTVIGLRYKENSTNLIDPSTFLFNTKGTTTSSKSRFTSLNYT